MTNAMLTRERNIFLLGYLAVFLITGGFALYRELVPSVDLVLLNRIFIVYYLVSRAVLAYLTVRLARFLGKPTWLVVGLAICNLVPRLGAGIPLVALLWAVGAARGNCIDSKARP